MTKQIIQTAGAPQAIGTYSQAVRTGNTVYLSGQIGLDPITGQMVEGGVEAEARQVLMNLLGNAIKFTETGTVSLRVTLESDLVSPTLLRFSVQDTGIGIPEDKLGRVFERFVLI